MLIFNFQQYATPPPDPGNSPGPLIYSYVHLQVKVRTVCNNVGMTDNSILCEIKLFTLQNKMA